MLDVEAGRNDTRFVEMAIKLDDNFAWTMVVDYLEFANVSMALHDAKEFDNDLGWRSNKHLSLSTAFGVDNVVQAVIEDGYANHFGAFFVLVR